MLGFFVAKLKIPCFPGFCPVMKVVHATGVCAGIGGMDKPHQLFSLIFFKVGNSLIHFSIRNGLAPSKPMTSTFFFLFSLIMIAPILWFECLLCFEGGKVLCTSKFFAIYRHFFLYSLSLKPDLLLEVFDLVSMSLCLCSMKNLLVS